MSAHRIDAESVHYEHDRAQAAKLPIVFKLVLITEQAAKALHAAWAGLFTCTSMPMLLAQTHKTNLLRPTTACCEGIFFSHLPQTAMQLKNDFIFTKALSK